MNKKTVIGVASATLALGAVASVGTINVTSVETKAATATTVYCAINPATLGSYTLKLNTKQANDKWFQYNMTDTGNTFLGLKLFSSSFTDLYDGVDVMQFQLYDGDTQINSRDIYTSWTPVTTYNGKTYLYDKWRWYDDEPTTTFVKNGLVGDTLTYNVSNDQFEGVITTTSDGETLKVRQTIGEESTDYYDLEDGVTVANEDLENKCVTITTAGAYVVYFKEYSKQMWVTEADAALVAYAYAGYFLTNIGCDPDGVSTPTGWSDCEDRYENLSDGVKDYIYNFNIATAKDGENDDIVRMIRRYEWAISHNPNSLSHFIVNSSDTERPLSAYYNPVSGITSSSESNASTWALAAIAGVTALASGAFFLLRRKNEE